MSTTAHEPGTSSSSANAPAGGQASRVPGRIELLLRHPLSTYYLLGGSTLLLLVLGLIMVTSASAIESFTIHGSPYTLALRQLMFAAIGVVVMWALSRRPQAFWRPLAWPVLLVALGLLVAVLFVGTSVNGQRNWIDLFGPFRLQPAEIAKFALVLWGADLLTRKDRYLDTWKHLLVPFVPVAATMMLLVILGNDVGNTFMLLAIMCGMLFAAGAPLRLFLAIGAAGALGIWLATLAAPYRMARFTGWLNPEDDPLGGGWQLIQGQYALGTGGFWGVGLGASREKWGSLPEAHTDFIFSVIGEELGLVGTLGVLVLLLVQAFAIFRLARMTRDPFVRLAAAGVGSWIVVQSVVNVGAVLGLLPITGVTLPLVSYGGSSLVPTLAAIGMLLAFSREEPDARRALRRRSTAASLQRAPRARA